MVQIIKDQEIELKFLNSHYIKYDERNIMDDTVKFVV